MPGERLVRTLKKAKPDSNRRRAGPDRSGTATAGSGRHAGAWWRRIS